MKAFHMEHAIEKALSRHVSSSFSGRITDRCACTRPQFFENLTYSILLSRGDSVCFSAHEMRLFSPRVRMSDMHSTAVSR